MSFFFKTKQGALYLGNCEEIIPEIPKYDLVVCSPPYDNLREYKGYSFNFQKIAFVLSKSLNKGGVIVWIVSDATIKGSETGTSFYQALFFKDVCGLNLHDTMIYKKKNYIPLTHNRYEQSWEYMFVFSKGRPKTFNPIKIPCKNAGKNEKYGFERRQNFGNKHSMRVYEKTTFIETKKEKTHPNIFEYGVGGEKSGHPAPFPLQLARDQIKTWSNKGDIVLDPFMGSGTVAIACEELERKWIGIEISEEYCELIKKRVLNDKTLF